MKRSKRYFIYAIILALLGIIIIAVLHRSQIIGLAAIIFAAIYLFLGLKAKKKEQD